jgi:hypothetical protein
MDSLSFECGASSWSGGRTGKDPGMSDPSPLVFEICTAIDRFQERVPDLSVSEVLVALGEVSMALRERAPKRHSEPNLVSFSDYQRRCISRRWPSSQASFCAQLIGASVDNQTVLRPDTPNAE